MRKKKNEEKKTEFWVIGLRLLLFVHLFFFFFCPSLLSHWQVGSAKKEGQGVVNGPDNGLHSSPITYHMRRSRHCILVEGKAKKIDQLIQAHPSIQGIQFCRHPPFLSYLERSCHQWCEGQHLPGTWSMGSKSCSWLQH